MQTIEKNNLKGILLMLINALSMSLLYTVIKFLTRDLSSNLVVFLYKFLVMLTAIPFVIRSGGFRTPVFHLHALRGLFSTLGALLVFFALAHINLTDVTALGYLEQVLLMIIGVVVFKERGGSAKFFSIVFALVGAFFIIYKDFLYLNEFHQLRFQDHFPFQNFTKYHFFVFLSVVVWAGNRTLVKILGRTERASVQLFYVSFFSVLIAFPFAFFQTKSFQLGGLIFKLPYAFQNFSNLGLKPIHLLYLPLLVVLYGSHSLFTFKALQYADLSAVVPFEYTRLIFTAILGFFLFDEVHNVSVFLGCSLIILSGFMMFHDEKRAKKKIILKNLYPHAETEKS